MVRTSRPLVIGGMSSVWAMMAANPILSRHMPVFEAPKDVGFSDPEFKAAIKGLKDTTDEMKTWAEKANTEIKNLGKVSEETKLSADKALTNMNDLSAKVADMEQKLAKRFTAAGVEEVKSIGQRFVESEGVKEAMTKGQKWKGREVIEVKDILSTSATGPSTSTALVVPDRQAMVMLPNRAFVVRDLLMPGRTVSGSIEYGKESVFTNAAAMVAEDPSAPKPQSDITYTLTATPVRTLAHFIMASKQIMEDAPQLQSLIDFRLRYGLSFVEDAQLLMGDGTGQNLMGLIPQATAYAKPSGMTVQGMTMIDVLRLAMLQATLALYPATGHVLHPTDWASIELTKDTQNRYIFANPQAVAGATMWGLPVATSLAMVQGTFLTGALKYAAQIFDRDDATVAMSTEDRDNFVRNMITILAEERLALAVYRPQALITGNFKNAIAAN